MFWEHAHNDIVEFAIELGLPGMLLFAALAGSWIVALIRNYFWENAVCVALVLALGLTFVHAWWEFVFQCPAILVLYGVLAVVAVMFSLIGAFYYLRIVKLMYFDDAVDNTPIRPRMDAQVLLSVNGLAVLAFGIFPQPLMALCASSILASL